MFFKLIKAHLLVSELYTYLFMFIKRPLCWFQLPRGLRCRSTAARLLRLWVRIPPWAWTSVSSKCCVLSGRGLCDELITHPEESYRLWCVVVCDLETSWMRRPWPTEGLLRKRKRKTHCTNYTVVRSDSKQWTGKCGRQQTLPKTVTLKRHWLYVAFFCCCNKVF